MCVGERETEEIVPIQRRTKGQREKKRERKAPERERDRERGKGKKRDREMKRKSERERGQENVGEEENVKAIKVTCVHVW